jgi:hypothetical protein
MWFSNCVYLYYVLRECNTSSFRRNPKSGRLWTRSNFFHVSSELCNSPPDEKDNRFTVKHPQETTFLSTAPLPCATPWRPCCKHFKSFIVEQLAFSISNNLWTVLYEHESLSSEVLRALKMLVLVFWVESTCEFLGKYHHSWWTCSLYCQPSISPHGVTDQLDQHRQTSLRRQISGSDGDEYEDDFCLECSNVRSGRN